MKILNLCSAYKTSGLLHILRYMRDDDNQDDATRLLGLDNIRKSARYIRRLALAFTTAFQIKFLQQLSTEEASILLEGVSAGNSRILAAQWDKDFKEFLERGCRDNTTFALHFDMMSHACEVAGIQLAERIGGPLGYHLLRACMKSSLTFSFTNGASSYAAYSTRLLTDHSTAPFFFQRLKESYFSIPYEGSGTNFGLDTVREEDHRKCKKFFRPGADVSVITRRMNLMDEMNEMQEKRTECLSFVAEEQTPDVDHSNWKINEKDAKYIIRGASLIIRRGGIAMAPSPIPYNVYSREPTALSTSVLDIQAEQSGQYLLFKYCAQEGLFGITQEDVQKKADALCGPKELTAKVAKTKSVTINRNRCQATIVGDDDAKSERLRMRTLAQEKKKLEGLYSLQNTCQAIVNPQCSKYKVMKSATIPRALITVLGICLKKKNCASSVEDMIRGVRKAKDIEECKDQVLASGLVQLKVKHLPVNVARSVKAATVENAGVSYKSSKGVLSGSEYIRHVEDRWITGILTLAPELTVLVISEEKYSYTPDLFKGATRAQRVRTTSSQASIAHLRTGSDIISEDTFSKSSVVSTAEGKRLISTYIPQNAHRLSTKRQIEIIFDSELHVGGCTCTTLSQQTRVCACRTFTTPIACYFNKSGLQTVEKLCHIKQAKGEAECAQVDWLFEVVKFLNPGEAVLAVVTSADIDSVVLHLFALSIKWEKEEDGKYRNPVYVLLQKAGHFDLYNITGILELLEASFPEQRIGAYLACCLCLGGNDFLPKLQNMSHLKLAQVFLSNQQYRNDLFLFNSSEHGLADGTLNRNLYLEFVKELYCPKNRDASSLTYDEVCLLSIKPTKVNTKGNELVTFTFVDGQADLKHPKRWMPPASCLEKLATLVDAMMQYILSLGIHDAPLPDFSRTCLVKSGKLLEYDLGVDAHVKSLKALFGGKEDSGQLRKRPLDVTPRKTPQKRRPVTSTPKKGFKPRKL